MNYLKKYMILFGIIGAAIGYRTYGLGGGFVLALIFSIGSAMLRLLIGELYKKHVWTFLLILSLIAIISLTYFGWNVRV